MSSMASADLPETMAEPASSFVPGVSDVLLVGGGILSATLGAMLKRLEPRLSIQMVEVHGELGREASDAWNNAGTGHAGVCEMSYTPSRGADGRVPIGRALAIFEQFEHSRQFWAHAAATGVAGPACDFIRPVPHLCFVEGAADVDFLRARHEAMRHHHFFRSLRCTLDPAVIRDWAPLVMEGRGDGPVAATAGAGTEVDFGLLARRLGGWLARQDLCGVATRWKVTELSRGSGSWRVRLRCMATGETRVHRSRFVFVGAGGGSVPLILGAGLPEASGLAGFPIGGQWLVCDDPDLCRRHSAKVYGATPPSSPSLGAPHLDLRHLNGRPRLMFGPFASWTSRFLRHSGGWTDLPRSVRAHNLAALARAGLRNHGLVRYLVREGLQTMESRLRSLRRFLPDARAGDWRLVEAGIRVQAIRASHRGAIHFGTEVFSSSDGSFASVLGASPGASVSVSVALEVVRTCLPRLLDGPEACERMRRMIPGHGIDLKQPGAEAHFERLSREADELLGLTPAGRSPLMPPLSHEVPPENPSPHP